MAAPHRDGATRLGVWTRPPALLLPLEGVGHGVETTLSNLSLAANPPLPRAVFCVYAMAVFEWRRRKILRRDPSGYDDPLGPALLTMALLAALVGVSYVAWEDTVKSSKPTPTVASNYSLFPAEYAVVHVSNATLTSFPLTGKPLTLSPDHNPASRELFYRPHTHNHRPVP